MPDEPTDQLEDEPIGDTHPEDDPETFPRDYVVQLRREAAEARVRARQTDELAQRLLEATAREATAGILADPTDLALGDELLDDDGFPDAERIAAAARSLVERKPHLGDRRPAGDVDQGARDEARPFDFSEVLRSAAG